MTDAPVVATNEIVLDPSKLAEILREAESRKDSAIFSGVKGSQWGNIPKNLRFEHEKFDITEKNPNTQTFKSRITDPSRKDEETVAQRALILAYNFAKFCAPSKATVEAMIVLSQADSVGELDNLAKFLSNGKFVKTRKVTNEESTKDVDVSFPKIKPVGKDEKSPDLAALIRAKIAADTALLSALENGLVENAPKVSANRAKAESKTTFVSKSRITSNPPSANGAPKDGGIGFDPLKKKLETERALHGDKITVTPMAGKITEESGGDPSAPKIPGNGLAGKIEPNKNKGKGKNRKAA